MSVTGLAPANRESVQGQIERLTRSEILQNSESLCKLLRYLGEHALEAPGTPVKEYQIATEVFGRPRDFDPRLDSTVRVQTGRLRSKLSEYYTRAGSEDPIIVELPKGAYALQVRWRPAPEPPTEPKGDAHKDAPTRRWGRRLAWVFPVVSALLAVALVYEYLKQPFSAAVASPPVAPASLRTFWGSFINGPERPWLVFSNAEFVGRPETGMRYYVPGRDPGDRILDHYTGIGEVIAVHELDSLFADLHREIRVKRGRLLSIDDAKNNNIVFIGSPSENLALRAIPAMQDFVFQRIPDGPRKGDLGIFNVRPRPGESTMFTGSAALPVTEDYAVIGQVPGLNPNCRVMVLAGTTTIGTQAAAEFVARAKNVEDLLGRLGVPETAGRVPFFETVLKVGVNMGVPVRSEIAAVHLR